MADLSTFLRKKKTASRPTNTAKTILYVGRFSVEKNLPTLLKAFSAANQAHGNIHKLILIGDGPLKSQFESNQNIEIYPFMSASELATFVEDKHVDIFCLPSLYEPWGVVIHEFAAAGLPLLLSNRCGASTKFLIEGYNGFSFNPEKYKSLLLALNNFLKLESDTIKSMGENSYSLAHQITPNMWAATLQAILLRSDLSSK